MKPIHELLGFAVLTGPLWFILITLVVSLWVARKVAKRFTSNKTRLAVGVSVFLLIFCMPFADEIAGRIYFYHLCATQAGVKVYDTFELPAKYWDAAGKHKFLKANGDLDVLALEDRFEESTFTIPYSSIFRIDERHHKVIDNNTSKTLGEVINFLYWGGWISWNLSAHRSAVDCRELHGNKFWRNFYSSLFRPLDFSR